ncbi:MAG: acylneuraminate cytidylyltransferase family protein [Candidatus Omnitrophica bacterium]|nr:acylneuraminate cytidylyltransferase family protein [Candidatus Omnitrophota bacterium]
MKALCVIPARGGSKGIPGKNIRLVDGKPLIGFVIEAVVRSGVFDKAIVSTDSAEIADIVNRYYPEIDVPFIRPAELAGDDVPVTAVIKHAVDFYEKEDFGLVFSVQSTNPFTRPETLTGMLDIMNGDKCDSIVTIAKILHLHPFRSYRYDSETMRISPLTQYTKELFLQKQDRPDAYGLTGGVLGRRSRLIKEWAGKGLALGEDQRGYVVQEEEAFDLDTPFEMNLFESLISARSAKAAMAMEEGRR